MSSHNRSSFSFGYSPRTSHEFVLHFSGWLIDVTLPSAQASVRFNRNFCSSRSDASIGLSGYREMILSVLDTSTATLLRVVRQQMFVNAPCAVVNQTAVLIVAKQDHPIEHAI